MHRLYCTLAFATLVVFSPRSAGAITSLTVSPDARSEGMGRSWGYLERGPLAAWGNPAAILSDGSGIGVSVSAADLTWWRDLRYGAISYDGFMLLGRMAAVNLNYISLKEQNEDYKHEDYDEKTFGAAFAMEVGANIRAGIGFKSLRQHRRTFVGVEGPDSASAFPIWDAGLIADIPLSRRDDSPRLCAGLSLNNLGAPLQKSPESSLVLPSLLRCAIGFETRQLPSHFKVIGYDRQVHWIALSSSIGIEQRLNRSGSAHHRRALGVGLEVKTLGIASLRAGYIDDRDNNTTGPTFGFGISLSDYFNIDFASVKFFDGTDNAKKLSAAIRIPTGRRKSHEARGLP